MQRVIEILPSGKKLTAESGELLLHALACGGYYLPAACGGNGICGKCKVKIIRGETDGAEIDENGFVLACKARIKEDISLSFDGQTGTGLSDFFIENTVGEERGLGVALDIGTTTLAACCVRLETGEIIQKTSCLNPQSVFGADVLSRIQACGEGKLSALQACILNKTKDLLQALSKDEKITELTVCANTTMLHIFAGVNPVSIGRYPFAPVFTETVIYARETLGLPVERVRLLPSVSGYIGSDVTAGVLALGLETDKEQGIRLFLDIGTNGEIVLSNNGKLFATSTAAGPALEGASIECGMGGTAGAVDRVFERNGELAFTVLGGGAVKGICGSGLIDLVSLLLQKGFIDENGAWNEDCEHPLSVRLAGDKFYLTDTVYLSQKDIRQFQLAKAAIRAGMDALLAECGVRYEDVVKVYVAGGLGYYMNAENAVRVGMFPKAFLGKIETVGNTALAGTRLCLLKASERKRIEKIALRTQIVELALLERFNKEYVEQMCFLNKE